MVFFGRVCRRNGPLLALGTLLASSLLTRCGGHTSSQAAPGADAASAGTSGISAQCNAATVAQDCPLPVSTCSDATTLAYYTSPACVAGKCQWLRATMVCSNAAPCVAGECAPSVTTTSPPPDSGIALDSGLDASPPFATCASDDAGPDAGDAGACELPTSVCASADTLLYFTDPICVNGVCQADVHTQACDFACINGGCQGPAPTK
ncbi:MAG TPA: hypothetical protein VGM29_12415 [Polyangiaceae bacterium]|jgi:hypothetical protein